jgi:hypothetical protein
MLSIPLIFYSNDNARCAPIGEKKLMVGIPGYAEINPDLRVKT